MEECDGISEDTNQPKASPNQHQQPPNYSSLDDFMKKIADDLVTPPENDAADRQGLLDNTEERLVVLDDREGTQAVLDDREGTQVVLNDIKSTQVVVDDVEGTQVVLNDIEGTQVVLDDREGTQVVLNDIKRMQVVVDDVEGMQVVLDDIESTQVALNDIEGTQVALNDIEGTQVVLNDIEVTQVALNDIEGTQVVVDDVEGRQEVLGNTEERQGVHDDASNDPGVGPWSSRPRKRYHASLEPIVEGMTAATRLARGVAAPDSAAGPASSSHYLQLAETTPSMIAMTSRTSVDSLASGQSASVQTIFQTPDWADDDSDNRLSEQTVLPAQRLKQSRIVDEEQASPTPIEDGEQSPASALAEDGGQTATELLEGSEMLDLSANGRLSANTGQDTPENDGNWSAIEVEEQSYTDLRDFDPLNAAVLPSPRSDDEVNADIHGCNDASLASVKFETPVLAPLVLMQFAVLQNAGLTESKETASTLHGSDDLIQFDKLPEKVSVAEESLQSTSVQPSILGEVKKSDQKPISFPSPPHCTNDEGMLVDEKSEPPAETPVAQRQNQDLRHPGLADFQHSLNQLKDHRDLSRAGYLSSTMKEGETAKEHPRSRIDELDAALNSVLRPKSKTRPPSFPNSTLKEGEVEASAADGKKDVQRLHRAGDEMPPEQLPPSNKPKTESQNVETFPQERYDLISFDSTEEVRIASRTAGGTATPQLVRNELDYQRDAPSASSSRTMSKDADPTNRENSNLGEKDTDRASSQSQGPKDEIEIELIKTSSEIHQIRLSSSELLQDFYDMRKAYAGEFSRGSQSVARTVAECDRPASDLTADARRRQGPEVDLQSHRIDSAIDLMDATIDEIQRWQTKKGCTLAERDTGKQDTPVAGDAAAARKAVDAKRSKPLEVVRSSTVPSAPAVGRGRPPSKPANGSVQRRDARPPRADTSRPMTSHVPSRNKNASGRSTAPPRRDVLTSQEKRPSGDAKSPFVAAAKRVQPTRPSINIPAAKLQRTPSARFGRSATAKSARTLQPQTPEDEVNELKKCTMSPAAYLERCLARTQVDVAKAKRPAPQKDSAKPAATTRRALTQPETLNKTAKAVEPDVGVPLSSAATRDSNVQKVDKPKEMLIPQKLIESSKKETNLPSAATNVAATKDGDQHTLKPKNRFLSDEDIEKWVRLSTRYARCAEMGASLFTSKHSCEGDKESVKSDGSLVQTASDVLMDSLMDTVTSAVKKTSRSKKGAKSALKTPTATAAKDILSRLSVGDTRCITQLKTEEKVNRSVNNLVRSMSKIVDSTSDSRVCWDSSLDSLPTTAAERDAGMDEVQEAIVQKSRQVVDKMTDTLIKHLGNQPDELDFKVADDFEPMTHMSMDDVIASDLRRPGSGQKSSESLKRWSDTKSTQLEVILSRLMQTTSSSSSWGLASQDADVVPDSVRSSRHKLATLENIVALLNGIDRTCKSRENNVEWDDPAVAPRPPSMAPLPDRAKRAHQGSHAGSRRKNARKDNSRRKAGSHSSLPLRQPSIGGGKKQERLSYCNTCEEKLRRPSTPPKSTTGSRHSNAGKRTSKGSPSARMLARSPSPRQSASSSDRGGSRRSSHCMACVEKKRQASASAREARRRRRSLSNASARSLASKASASKERDAPKKARLSYCDTCDRKLKKKRAEERGETTPKTPRRSLSVTSEKRERSLSPAMRRGSSLSSGSSNLEGSSSKSHRFSYCDTCDEKRRKEALAKERGESTPKNPRRSLSVTSERRERSLSPAMRRGSSLSSGSSNLEGSSSKSHRFSYCDTCDEKRRKEALAKERGETTPPKRSVSNASARSRSRSPLARPSSSISSGSSVEGNASKKTRYSYCNTCDEKLRNQSPPATPLKERLGGTVGSWRSDSSQDLGDDAMSRPRVSFSAPLEFFERRRGSPSAAQKENARPARQSVGAAAVPTKERRSQPTLRPPSPRSNVPELRKTDSLFSNLSASLSRDSASDNYSSATFIIADQPSRQRVDLALPKIRHVEGTRSTYKHVLQKAFMDRLDNIIKVQSASSHVALTPKPSATSATSMARFTLKKPELSSSDKYNMRHHIPTATEIRARMKRCCDRMPSRDIFGVEISRESLTGNSRQRVVESEQSLGFLDEVLDLDDFVQSSVSPAVRNQAFSTTYASVIQRDRPFLASTKISRKIQSFIKRDLSSWDKLTNDCIQSVRKDVNILPITAAPATGNVLKSASSRFNQSEEDLLLALIAALGGSPRTKPSLLASREPVNIAKETVKAMRKNKMYRQRDNLEQDEVVIPIDDYCSSETLLRTVNVVLKTDTEASVTPSESRSTVIDSPSSSTDYEVEHMAAESNVEQVLKSVTELSYPPSVRNMEIDSTGSSTDFEHYVTTDFKSQGQHVLENVARFSYSPREKDSDTSTAMSSSDVEKVETGGSDQVDGVFQKVDGMTEKDVCVTIAESRDAEIVGTQAGGLEANSDTKCLGATSEGDMPSAENIVEQEDARTEKSDSYTLANTADSNSAMPSKSSHSSLDHLFLSAPEESRESSNLTSCVKEAEDNFSVMKVDSSNSSRLDSNDSNCSIPEMLERLEMAVPFQHERFAIETNSGMSMPMVDAVTEDTWDKLTHAISHLPQEAINTGDEIYSRHQHPNLPLDVRADMELYNECQDDEYLYQNQKLGNRGKSTRDGVCGIRQTKSLLSDNYHEPKASEELQHWGEDTDGIVAASGDTDFLNSDGVSLIANASTEVCVTESVADQSLLDDSSSSMISAPNNSVSTSTESLAMTFEDTVVSTENEILASLLDQVNTRSQLAVLNSRLDGVVRREQLVEEEVEPRVVEWRGASTVSALCLAFGAVVVGATMGIPSLWE